MSAKKALELIRSRGMRGLDDDEGCPCCDFEIHGVHVSVSCHKSEHCIRVFSHHLYSNPFDLEPIAIEIAAQLGVRDGYKVRFCDYSCDHVAGHWEGEHPNAKWVKTQQCCYCGAERPDEDAYLCVACLDKPEARGSYPWGIQGNMVSPEDAMHSLFAPLLENATVIVLGEKELRAMAKELNAKPN